MLTVKRPVPTQSGQQLHHGSSGSGGCPRDGATRWGIFYDAEKPGTHLESFLVDSWAEHLRQHARFTLADRGPKHRVLSFVLEPIQMRHFLYAERPENDG